MADRARHTLVKSVLEPQWEARFEPNSYGFRPGRSCHDAMAAIFTAIGQKAKYVLDADIEKCFDRLAHDALLAKLSPSPSLRRQLRAWLKAGVFDHGTLFPTEAGTMQGSPCPPSWRISPSTGWKQLSYKPSHTEAASTGHPPMW